MFTACDEKSVSSSSRVELISVSAVSFILFSGGGLCIIVFIFYVGEASRDVFVFSGIFVQVNGCFSAL